MAEKAEFEPIGWVRNEVSDLARRDWRDVVSEIIIKPELEPALAGIEDFSHIIVIFWFHKSPSKDLPLKIHPMGREELPLVGLFATRSPRRPNLIGISIVRLLERRGNILKVKGLDAVNNTPVLDIKPLFPGEIEGGLRAPEWARR